MTTEASISPITSSFRSHFRSQRAARKARLQLQRELSLYRSAADRAELDAIMARHTPEETAELRSLLP